MGSDARLENNIGGYTLPNETKLSMPANKAAFVAAVITLTCIYLILGSAILYGMYLIHPGLFYTALGVGGFVVLTKLTTISTTMKAEKAFKASLTDLEKMMSDLRGDSK
jgi:hypothetical protein